ncbi:hypothetical protein BCEP4_450015 [Burkholderia cepacia]|nr:hypothetical protein BCEP4_450015 [Burkholderia cepacia]
MLNSRMEDPAAFAALRALLFTLISLKIRRDILQCRSGKRRAGNPFSLSFVSFRHAVVSAAAPKHARR